MLSIWRVLRNTLTVQYLICALFAILIYKYNLYAIINSDKCFFFWFCCGFAFYFNRLFPQSRFCRELRASLLRKCFLFFFSLNNHESWTKQNKKQCCHIGLCRNMVIPFKSRCFAFQLIALKADSTRRKQTLHFFLNASTYRELETCGSRQNVALMCHYEAPWPALGCLYWFEEWRNFHFFRFFTSPRETVDGREKNASHRSSGKL